MSIPPFPAEPYSGVEKVFLEASLLVVIEHRGIRIENLRGAFDGTFSALGQMIEAGLFVPDGPAVAIYRGDPSAELDVQIGFPVMTAPTRTIPSDAGDIVASAFPAGNVAITSHVGSFDGLPAAWERLVAAADGTPTGTWIEAYVSDPRTSAPDQLRTDLLLPIR